MGEKTKKLSKRLRAAGFEYEHTGGNIHVWSKHVDGATVFVGHVEDTCFPPEGLRKPCSVAVEHSANTGDPRCVTFTHPCLADFLDSLDFCYPNPLPSYSPDLIVR